MSWDDKEEPELVTLHDGLTLLYTTEKAYLIRDKVGDEIWIPKSQVNDIVLGKIYRSATGKYAKEIVSITLPEWLAEDKGLIE